MKNTNGINYQSGAVSLFMVIFAMLLMSIVTISFLRIMTSDQNQASNNDLSQSAYDSAQAGVEDAKRALLAYMQQCKTDPGGCNSLGLQIATDECNAAIRLMNVVKTEDYSDVPGGAGVPEVKIQQSTAIAEGSSESIDAALDQAYTCVTIDLNTDDYRVPLIANESKIIPLIATGPFSSVTIEWFSRSNVPGSNGALDVPSSATSKPLLPQADWPTNRPSVLRAQFMQVGSSFSLGEFDYMRGSGESNANTVFLYPSTTGNEQTEIAIRDVRRAEDNTVVLPDGPADAPPTPARCRPTVGAEGYACSITLRLPGPMGGGNAAASYLRLTPLYNDSNIRVSLEGAQFSGVQPIIDSTGRANDLFRRVESRVDLYDTSFPYPDAALEVNGNVCKDFGVTDTNYLPGSNNCTP